MKCYQCGNEDKRYFAYDKGVYYCRKCVAFGRMDAYVRKESCHLSTRVIEVSPQLKYELTDKQKAISHKIVGYLKQKMYLYMRQLEPVRPNQFLNVFVFTYRKERKWDLRLVEDR